MRRRDFVGMLGVLAGWAIAAAAQTQGRVYRLGVLTPFSSHLRPSPDPIRMGESLGARRPRSAESGELQGENTDRRAPPNAQRPHAASTPATEQAIRRVAR
jgi:hypothetical protein